MDSEHPLVQLGPAPRIVLVHGLMMGRPVMQVLARRARKAGFAVSAFGYNTITGTLAESAARLTAFLQTDTRPVILVGHSLGGLVALQAAQALPTGRLAAVMLLGSPYQGARAAEVLHGAMGGALQGVARALRDWAELPEKPTVSAPVFTLGGTRATGLGRVLCQFTEPSDGTVTLAETYYPDATSAVLPVSHTGMLFDREVATQVVTWARSLPEFASR